MVTKKIAFALLVLSLFLLAGCGSKKLPLPRLFASDTPTPAPTLTPLPVYRSFTPTHTPAATDTPTLTPTPPASLSPCAFAETCPEAVNIRDLVDGELVSGGTYEVEVPYDIPVYFRTAWTAIDDATLAMNMQEMTFFFEIDGQSYLNEANIKTGYTQDPDDPTKTYSTVALGYVLENWKLDEPHTVRFGFTFANEIFDGWDNYPAGWLNEGTFVIIPVLPPTATPTTLPTNTPLPKPTTVPPTPTTACELSASILIKNDTGGQVTMNFTGPAKYTFNIAPGNLTLNLCPGEYSYTAYGCGGASTNGTASDGDEIEFWCE